jgi:hypothetical protein
MLFVGHCGGRTFIKEKPNKSEMDNFLKHPRNLDLFPESCVIFFVKRLQNLYVEKWYGGAGNRNNAKKMLCPNLTLIYNSYIIKV